MRDDCAGRSARDAGRCRVGGLEPLRKMQPAGTTFQRAADRRAQPARRARPRPARRPTAPRERLICGRFAPMSRPGAVARSDRPRSRAARIDRGISAGSSTGAPGGSLGTLVVVGARADRRWPRRPTSCCPGRRASRRTPATSTTRAGCSAAARVGGATRGRTRGLAGARGSGRRAAACPLDFGSAREVRAAIAGCATATSRATRAWRRSSSAGRGWRCTGSRRRIRPSAWKWDRLFKDAPPVKFGTRAGTVGTGVGRSARRR